VTLGLFFSNKISLMKLVCYIPMQMLGACTGAGLVRGVNPTAYFSSGGGANSLPPDMTIAGSWGLEVISTFALVFVVLAATDGVRYPTVAHLPVQAPPFYPPPRMLAAFLLSSQKMIPRGRIPNARNFVDMDIEVSTSTWFWLG
jgi:hypothetical protein